MMTIRNNVGIMPGGVIYEDPRTPAATWTDAHTFVEERASQVQAFRRANPTIYPEPEWTEYNYIKQQIVEFNCRRIGYNPDFCFETNSLKSPPPAPVAERTCPTCVAVLVPVFCPTCSGQRITGYQCKTCKTDFPK